jgi:hypothetical protein
LESGSRTLPLLAILFVPIVAGAPWIYAWCGPTTNAEKMQRQSLYLNVPQFLLRAGVYFVCWLILSYFLNRWSRRQDETGDPRLAGWMRTLSGPGLVVCGLTLTFASFDWLMSLQPDWYSTIFSYVFAAGHALSALAFVVLVLALLADHPPLAGLTGPKTLIDLGNLLLAFVMFWTYVSFSQFLLIWAGNLPEEISWYVRRSQGGWLWFAVLLVILHFAVPFALLLSRDMKRNRRNLAIIAGLVLVMRLAALTWDVVPAYEPLGLGPHWGDLIACAITVLGVGGVWTATFLRELNKLPLVAIHDPRLREIVHE